MKFVVALVTILLLLAGSLSLGVGLFLFAGLLLDMERVGEISEWMKFVVIFLLVGVLYVIYASFLYRSRTKRGLRFQLLLAGGIALLLLLASIVVLSS